MFQQNRSVTSHPQRRTRLTEVYALLTSLCGILVLVRLLDYQTQSFDLLTLLPFAVLAVMVSYFRVPIGRSGVDLGLDGAILLGATLTGGPVIGGWAAFITGLVTSIFSFARKRPDVASRLDLVAVSALDGGRNVIAIGAAWMAFSWLGGTLRPPRLTAMLALALALMCICYVLVRTLLVWPAVLLQSTAPQEALAEISNPVRFLVELIPLPIAPLISPAFLPFGWTRFLVLALFLIGTGALVRRMVDTIHALENEIGTDKLVNEIKTSLDQAPPDAQAVCDLARQFCSKIVPAQCEIGLYNHVMTQVIVQSSSDGHTRSPLMRIPLTPLWEWIGQQHTHALADGQAQINELGLPLPTLKSGAKPHSVLLVPILHKPTQAAATKEQDKPDLLPVGALVLQSAATGAFDALAVKRILALCEQIGAAIQHTWAFSPHSIQATNQQLARQIQSDLLPKSDLVIEGWDIGVAWMLSGPPSGIWFDSFSLPDKVRFVLVEPQAQSLPAALTGMLTKALIQINASESTVGESELLDAVNAYLGATRKSAAILCATIDREHIISLANAGCAAPLWWHKDHSRVEVLRCEKRILGIGPTGSGEDKSIALAVGDALLVYTSSLVEASNGQEAFGEQRLTDLSSQLTERPAAELARAIVAQVASFCAEGRNDTEKEAHQATPFEDDVLVAVLRKK